MREVRRSRREGKCFRAGKARLVSQARAVLTVLVKRRSNKVLAEYRMHKARSARKAPREHKSSTQLKALTAQWYSKESSIRKSCRTCKKAQNLKNLTVRTGYGCEIAGIKREALRKHNEKNA